MSEQKKLNPNLYALLIGIDYYLPNLLSSGISYTSLKGCVNDINDVEQFLLRQPQTPTKIFKLTASNPESNISEIRQSSKPPTYKNIVAQFQELTETAAPGDLVYIQYSGHGGRATTNYPQIKGKKGLDEGLVPTDIGTKEGQYLRDLELAILLKKMVDKGLVVTIVLDCCHSGGAVRGGDTDIRGLDTIDMTSRPLSNLVASVSELTENWLSLTREQAGESGVTRKATAVANILPEVKGYVLLAACHPSELAKEYAFNVSKRNGALTYWLLDTLNQPMPGMTYKMVHDRIKGKIKTQFLEQTPMLMGEGTRLVLGSEYVLTEYAVNVLQVVRGNTTRLQLEAGQAQGLRKGAEFAIYPRGVVNFGQVEERIAVAEITELGATDSWAEVKTILRPSPAIEQGAQAVLTSAPVKLVRKVRLLKENDLSQENNQALQAVEMELSSNGWVELVGEEEAADYQVDIKKNKVDEVIYEICDRAGAPIILRPALKVNGSTSAQKVVQRLVHLSKYQAIQEMDNHDTSSPLRGKVLVELLGKQKDYESSDKPQPEPFTNPSDPELQTGEYLFFKIRNNYSRVVNVVVLDLQHDWAIDQVYPSKEDYICLDPQQEELISLQMNLEGEDRVEDILKVFATIGTANFRCLQLPSLDEPLPQLGAARSGSALDELLMAFAAEQPPIRKANPVAFPSREWTTVQFGVKVKGDNYQNNQTEDTPINHSSNMMLRKILILAANPHRDLDLSQEIEKIREALQHPQNREQYELEVREAVRLSDLQRLLSEVKPEMVHFCGHGSGSQGLVLLNDVAEQQLVSTKALKDLFRLINKENTKDKVKCVLLNACNSNEQAEAISPYVDYVIGMQQPIRDDTAIAFAVGFYESLASGRTIESAYEFGKNRIQIEINRTNSSTPKSAIILEHLNPVILKKQKDSKMLNKSDKDELIKLLILRDIAYDDRKAFCRSIGIEQPGQLPFINGREDNLFASALINHLNEIAKIDSICELCSKLKSTFSGTEHMQVLEDVIAKL
ncbi:caspase family protein [Plectonema cf. radiosum LEGE 06105]|uniref:Caspase family protein n=1 Tax=Plectonema cf. radiosum LEGE 06105 TaxID=945769 RepID=A0A8J7F2Z1_9CYAN|nr:caspase family protein [Plectonema radiosum]MBE9213992.1 caspase family protein [Plectonema cf. radiosum LEGE 06105]